jgi:hypothetical protein
MRRTPDQRRAWVRERLLEALAVCGGELNRSALKVMAFGGEQVWSDEITQALDGLEAERLITGRTARGVGQHGAPTRRYRVITMTTVRPRRAPDTERMALDLAAEDRVALIDLVHGELEAARADAATSTEVQRQWLRISATLLAGELFGDDPAIDTESGDDVVTGGQAG